MLTNQGSLKTPLITIMEKLIKHVNILDAKAATGIGTTIDVRDFTHVTLSLGTASSANLTVKVQGAIALPSTPTTPPDFSAAQTVANNWDYVEVIDLEDGAAIDGDTGVSCAGTDDFRLFAVNTQGLDYLNCNVTARAAGSVTVNAACYNNS